MGQPDAVRHQAKNIPLLSIMKKPHRQPPDKHKNGLAWQYSKENITDATLRKRKKLKIQP